MIVPVPEPILAHLREVVTLRWSGRDVAPPLEAIPTELPLGEVVRLSSGGPFGWMVDGRLDVVGGRLVLEALEDSRMAGPDHYRVWADGTTEPLENERIGYVYPKDATEADREAVQRAYAEHNRRVSRLLRERGFRAPG